MVEGGNVLHRVKGGEDFPAGGNVRGDCPAGEMSGGIYPGGNVWIQ